MPSFLSPLLRNPSHSYALVNTRTERVIAGTLIGAFDSKARRTGLLSHSTFPLDSAMIIAPTNAIHTFFMKFDIDVLFVAKDGRVVKIREGLRPWRIAAAWHAYCVIELAARAIEVSAIREGDILACAKQ